MAERRVRFDYPGTDVDVVWDRRLCIHVQACTRAKEGVFERGRDPWGDPDQADADTVVQIVARCPSGALTSARSDGGVPETPDDENTISVASRGPLYVRGDLQIAGAPDDMPGVRMRAALCRCGQSANKPFCDNSHEESGFADRGTIGDTGTVLEATGEPLTVTPMPNGPLKVEGNMRMVSSDGGVVWQGTKATLCRCGQSGNKPFCDATHRRVGWASD